jgi:hypothetical protein
MKTYGQIAEESLKAEAKLLVQEALEDPAKMDILMSMLNEEVANTASAPGLAMVSDGEPVSPKYSQKPFGKGIWRRKRRKDRQ